MSKMIDNIFMLQGASPLGPRRRYGDKGYYVHSWHSGKYNRDTDLIPWNNLGLCYCTCKDCVKERDEGIFNHSLDLISYHWASPVDKKDELYSFRKALEMVIQ